MVTTTSRIKRDKSNSSSSNKRRRRALIDASERLLGTKVKKIEYPGGRSRESCRMILEGGRSVIATRRSKSHRAKIEAGILRALNKHDAPVPMLLDTDGDRIILQEEIKGRRLSLALKDSSGVQLEELLNSAIGGLVSCQLAGTAENVEASLPGLGVKEGWITGLLKRPVVIGEFFDVPAPKYDSDALSSLLRVSNPRFVKWDSRPGNALVSEDGRVYWYDWEHAGARNRLDDLAWLLCDEFVPDCPDVEDRVLERFVEQFADSGDVGRANDYLMAYGTFHTLVRLGLVLKNKRDGDWWDTDYCIDRDKVGITQDCAQRLCARGSRWASKTKATAPLAPWFKSVAERIVEI